ncbi:unnamed protein product [Paramecium sonneborni]|nr:unnamed protein product [Paramecium sonneborni]
MIFVVGVVNQNNINKNIFEYISTEFQSNEEKKQKEQLQKDLKTTEQELSKHNNALLIKIDIFHFAVLVYPNPNNSYCLRSEDLENLTFFDSFLQQIEFYENILGQLKFVQNNWIINQFQDNQILFQKVNRYPDFFQLRIGQTILVRSKKASLNISINSVDQIYD